MPGRGEDEPHMRPRAVPESVRIQDLPFKRLESTGERYLEWSWFARLGFLARWNIFLGADGYQMPLIYPTRDFNAEPVGFDIRGYGLHFEHPVVDPMVSSAFDAYQDFARPDFSPAERLLLRERKLAEQHRQEKRRHQ